MALAALVLVSLAFAGTAQALPGDPCLDCPPGAMDVTLTITVAGSGSVSQGTTVLCSTNTSPCDVVYAEGSSPTVTASAGTGMTFDGWSGECSGTGTCSPDMSTDRAVTATFADHTPPAAPTITSPTSDQVIQSASGGATTISFNNSGDASAASFRCRMDVADATGASPCTSAWPTGALSTGTHIAYVWAQDSATNRSAPASVTFKVVNLPDTTISGTPAADSLTNQTSTAFGYSSPTGTSYLCTLDGNSVPCSANVGPLSQGSHTLTAKAGISPFGDNAVYYDATPASRTFTVDSVAPTVSITSGPSQDTLTTDTSASFTFAGNDPAPGSALTFECSLDGAPFAACPASYSGLALGAHIFRVRVTDAAGNVSAAAERNWTVFANSGSGGANSDTGANGGSNAAGTAGGESTPPPASTAAVVAKLARSFKVSRKGALVKALTLSGVTAGAAVTLSCKGKGCAFRSKTVALKSGAGTLHKLFKKKPLKPGAVITIKITHPGMAGKAFTLTVKKQGQPALKTASA